MFTNKDIEFRSIFVINCIEKRNLRVSNGELLLEEEKDSVKTTLTKMPFQKILALFVVGHITITTALIDKCKKYNVTLIVVKPNLRPIFYWSNMAEANYLLKEKQYKFDKNNISIAKVIVENKIKNQLKLLERTRKCDEYTKVAIQICKEALSEIENIADYYQLMGTEGFAAKHFFQAYFQQYNWKKRMPRVKTDFINATLDIGYTILFNYIECFVRMFGFDTYVGIYHRLWFKRKSLICDLMEPFRCIIENTLRNALNRKQCKESDFNIVKNEYILKRENNIVYQQLFFNALIEHKQEVFKYIQKYYRAFMQGQSTKNFPQFII
jgi:CRISPR-associated endonuclease Cas1